MDAVNVSLYFVINYTLRLYLNVLYTGSLSPVTFDNHKTILQSYSQW